MNPARGLERSPTAGVGRQLGRSILLALLAGCSAPTSAEEPAAIGPENVGGLEAWYRIESLHKDHNESDPVVGWKDSSGRGHHLQADLKGVKSVFVLHQLNGKPAVHVRKASTFRVFQAFDLDDHTIFLVYRSDYTTRALFSSEADPRKGMVLREEARFHQYQHGSSEFAYIYNKPVPMGKDFAIVALAREDGLLGCFINGQDFSSSTRFSEPIRVGTFFYLEHTQFAQSDGEGLHLAEMIFFNRYLPGQERDGVTRYLAEKFEIEVSFAKEPVSKPALTPTAEGPDQATARAWLSSRDRTNLNVEAFVIPWDAPDKLEAPFAFKLEDSPSQLRCEEDGTRAQLWVSAPIEAKQAGTAIRLLVLKNGTEYLPEYAESGPILGPEGEPRKIVELRATVALDAGDFVEIVATRDGAEGQVLIQESGATWAITLADGEAEAAPPEAPAPLEEPAPR